MKNLKLSLKIGISFSVVLFIVAVLFGITIFKMNGIQKESQILEKKYMPEISIYTDLERSLNKTAYAMKVYVDTRDEKFYIDAVKNFRDVRLFISKAKDQSSKSFNVHESKQNITDLYSKINKYEQLIAASSEKIESIKSYKKKLSKVSELYRIYCVDLLDFSYTDYNNLLNSPKLNPSVLRKKFEYISSLNEIVSFGTFVEKKAERAFADRDISFLKEAINIFDVILQDIQRLESDTNEDKYIQMLNGVKNGAIEFKESAEILIRSSESLKQFEIYSEKIVTDILNTAAECVQSDVNSTIKSVEQTTENIKNTFKLILVVSIFIIILTICLSAVLTKVIIKPIYESLKFSEKIAEGDFTAKLTLNRSDEIGKLMKSFEKTKDSLSQMIAEISYTGNSLFESADELSKISNTASGTINKLVEKSNSVNISAEDVADNIRKNITIIEQISSNLKNIAESFYKLEVLDRRIYSFKPNMADILSYGQNNIKNVFSVNMEGLAQLNRILSNISGTAQELNLIALESDPELSIIGFDSFFNIDISKVKYISKKLNGNIQDLKSQIYEFEKSFKKGGEGISQFILYLIDESEKLKYNDLEHPFIKKGINQKLLETRNLIDGVVVNLKSNKDISENISHEINEVYRYIDMMTNRTIRLSESADVLNDFAVKLKGMVGKFNF